MTYRKNARIKCKCCESYHAIQPKGHKMRISRGHVNVMGSASGKDIYVCEALEIVMNWKGDNPGHIIRDDNGHFDKAL